VKHKDNFQLDCAWGFSPYFRIVLKGGYFVLSN